MRPTSIKRSPSKKLIEIEEIMNESARTIMNLRKGFSFKAARVHSYLEKLIPLLDDKNDRVKISAARLFESLAEKHLLYNLCAEANEEWQPI